MTRREKTSIGFSPLVGMAILVGVTDVDEWVESAERACGDSLE